MIRPVVDLLYGILGFVIVGIAYFVLSKKQLSHKAKFMLFLLGLTSFAIYLLWGLFNFGLEVGSELDLGAFQISYGISESLMWLLILLLPVTFAVLLMIYLKNFNWLKRFLLPAILVLIIAGLNLFQISHYIRQHQWDFEDGLYNTDFCTRGTEASCLQGGTPR